MTPAWRSWCGHFKQVFATAFPKSRQVLTVRPTEDGDFEKLFELEDFE